MWKITGPFDGETAGEVDFSSEHKKHVNPRYTSHKTRNKAVAAWQDIRSWSEG